MSINGTIPYKNYDEQIVEIGKKVSSVIQKKLNSIKII